MSRGRMDRINKKDGSMLADLAAEKMTGNTRRQEILDDGSFMQLRTYCSMNFINLHVESKELKQEVVRKMDLVSKTKYFCLKQKCIGINYSVAIIQKY